MEEQLILDFMKANNYRLYENCTIENMVTSGDCVMLWVCGGEWEKDYHQLNLFEVIAWVYSQIKGVRVDNE